MGAGRPWRASPHNFVWLMFIEINKLLAPLTTFKIGGRAEFFVEAKSIEDIEEATKFARERKLAVFILGGGSNVLLPDKGIKGLVIKIAIKGIKFSDKGDMVLVSAGAGESWDGLVGKAVKKNLGGIENLSLIPGTAGAAVYQNIGAYGVELKDVFESTEVIDINLGKIKRLSKEDCRFGYRNSVFQHKDGKQYIILSVELKLSKKPEPVIKYPDLIKEFQGKLPNIDMVRKAVIKIRKSKLVYPDTKLGTAGSFFKNPVIPAVEYKNLLLKYPDLMGREKDGVVKLFAGQLIEKAGWKGKRFGKVGVSEKHSLVLVNYGGGKSKDTVGLANKVIRSVKNMFGVVLEPEVRIIG